MSVGVTCSSRWSSKHDL